MTDTNTSDATIAPAAASAAPAPSVETPAATFGSTRGSGLLRGKRPSGVSAPAAKPVQSDYKPTSVEIITPAREYKNPFAEPEPASPPAAEPVKETAPEAAAIPAEPSTPVAAEPAPAEPAPEVPAASEEKREINILPPAQDERPAVSWESSSPEREERPTFRPDRREDLQGSRQPRDPREQRQPRDPREARQPRDPREARQPRDPRDERPRFEQRPQRDEQRPAPQAAPAPKGFFGWLKGLFGGSKPAPAPTPAEGQGRGEFQGDGHRPRRRHRGGRGHGGNNQGFRNDRPQQGGRDFENRGGGEHGGGRRRRHRGGRDRGGNPRTEGHQGGGAI